MIDTLNFCYNIFLLLSYTAVLAIAVCLNMMRKRNIAIPVIGLYSVYLVDEVIIFMTEFLPSFVAGYNQTFIHTPSVKTVIFLASAFFTLSAWCVLTKTQFSPLQGLILIALGLWLIFVPMLNQGALESWLFFSGYQVFTIAICIYALWKLSRLDPKDHEGPFGWIRLLLGFTILFSIMIMLEDYYVIFHIDNYNIDAGKLHIFSRCFSEDILRLIYTVFFFRLFYKQFRLHWMSDSDDEVSKLPLVGGHPAAAAPSPSPTAAAEYKQLKFAREISLTERECDVCRLLLEGNTNQQIADQLHISTGTVKAHIHSIFQKAEVTHRYELLRRYDAFSPEQGS